MSSWNNFSSNFSPIVRGCDNNHGRKTIYRPYVVDRQQQVYSAMERQMKDLNSRVDRLLIDIPKETKRELKSLRRDLLDMNDNIQKYRTRVLAAEKQAETLREEVTDLKELLAKALSTVEQCRSEIKELGLAVEYAAGGPVYQEAKSHFEKLAES